MELLSNPFWSSALLLIGCHRPLLALLEGLHFSPSLCLHPSIWELKPLFLEIFMAYVKYHLPTPTPAINHVALVLPFQYEALM